MVVCTACAAPLCFYFAAARALIVSMNGRSERTLRDLRLRHDAKTLIRPGNWRCARTGADEPRERSFGSASTGLLSGGVGVLRSDLGCDELRELGDLRDLETRELVSNLDGLEAAVGGLVCGAKRIELALDARGIPHIAACRDQRATERVE